MSASERLPADLNSALKSGRAITLIADHRPAEGAEFSLTVIGLIDSVQFVGVFHEDGDLSTEFVQLPLPGGGNGSVSEIQTESTDARAIHQLWSLWNSGVRDGYLQFTRTIATALSLAKLNSALQGATVFPNDPAEAVSQPKQKKRRPASGGSTKRSRSNVVSRTGKRRGGNN